MFLYQIQELTTFLLVDESRSSLNEVFYKMILNLLSWAGSISGFLFMTYSLGWESF
jgi:hypothetical protein